MSQIVVNSESWHNFHNQFHSNEHRYSANNPKMLKNRSPKCLLQDEGGRLFKKNKTSAAVQLSPSPKLGSLLQRHAFGKKQNAMQRGSLSKKENSPRKDKMKRPFSDFPRKKGLNRQRISRAMSAPPMTFPDLDDLSDNESTKSLRKSLSCSELNKLLFNSLHGSEDQQEETEMATSSRSCSHLDELVFGSAENIKAQPDEGDCELADAEIYF